MQQLEEIQSQQSSLSCHNECLQPLVSVIIPTFNRPNQLLNAVKSVLRQTYTAFEVIVINDCGIDVSKILKIFADQRIFYISHATNKGLAATRNTGIQAARGKYIAYLDDDDEFFPNHLQTLVEALEGSKFKVAYTDGIKCLYEEHNSSTVLKHKFVEHSSDFDPHRLLFQNYIPVLCMMHAKSCLDHTGFFDEKLNVHEDWDLWIRLSRIFPFLHIKKNTCAYKIIINSNKNLSTSKGIDFITTMQTIYRKNLQLNTPLNIVNIQKKFSET
jgi:glycosyltransferase involved in cell wall biosynthesis